MSLDEKIRKNRKRCRRANRRLARRTDTCNQIRFEIARLQREMWAEENAQLQGERLDTYWL